MTARLCAAPGCYATAGSTGRCPTHASALARSRDARTTTEKGRGWEHQRLARRVLREETTCHLCGAPARPDDPLEVDHLVPLSMGGLTERANLAAAHRSCNRRKGGRDRLGRGAPRSSRGDVA